MMPIRTDCKPRANNRLFLGGKRGYAWTVLTGKTTTGNRPAARIIGNITTRRKGGGDGAGWKPNNRVAPGAGPVGPRVSRGDDGRRERGDGAFGAAGGRPPHRGRLCPLRHVGGLGCERPVPGRGSALRGAARRENRALRTSSRPLLGEGLGR